ncbi:MAG: Hsp20/alpha crystallin family protein [Deltaproteobacteria bacterium]|nr:Hsp20/alpha crystallin family protein [Deltaproteobacteria bacterium]
MALIKWEPRSTQLDPLRNLRGEVDRLFDNFFRGWPRPWTAGWVATQAAFVPACDLKETEKEFVVTAELPGFSKESLEVTVTEDAVTIKGQLRADKESQEEGYHLRESASSSFQRVIPLPGAVLPDHASARLKDGVLTLTLPKAEPSRTKGVKVAVD